MNKDELEFSAKYNKQHSQQYLEKHQTGFRRKLTTWRERQLAKKALSLADDPTRILDLPCGAGRFWDVLTTDSRRRLYAADNSEDMLNIAKNNQPKEIVDAFERIFQSSAFDIDMPDASVDSILCMRLLHHIGQAEDRLNIYREFHRVTKESVILSLWVDGNLQSSRRIKRDKKRQQTNTYQNRFVLPVKQVESEFEEAGFRIQERLDVMPALSMWRFYVLRKEIAFDLAL